MQTRDMEPCILSQLEHSLEDQASCRGLSIVSVLTISQNYLLTNIRLRRSSSTRSIYSICCLDWHVRRGFGNVRIHQMCILEYLKLIHSRWTYLVRDGPEYPIGHSINLGAQILTLCVASFGIVYNMRENRVRQAGKRDYRLDGLDEQGKRDLGHHHPDFKYIP